MANKTGDKGYRLEELLRAYFIRAGLFAVRGVPLRLDGNDLTDIDIWLYEKPTRSSRRRQIVDAKSKTKPKAIERLLWTKGLYELLEVDGAYIATTDTRSLLKEMSRRLGLQVLDGSDIKRMAESDKVLFPNRLNEEDIDQRIKELDKSRRNKDLQNSYSDLKSALIDNFGSGTVNRALEHFAKLSETAVACHPCTSSSETCVRLAYIAASFSAIAMDAALAKVSFKSADERRKTLLNIIRFGDSDEENGLQKVRIAAALVEKYAPNGRALSQSILQAIRDDFTKIPAEIIADHILAHLKSDGLFRVARALELSAFSKKLLGFDDLPAEEKAFIGVLLDFVRIDRAAFANTWKPITTVTSKDLPTSDVEEDVGSLFEDRVVSQDVV